MAWGRKTAFETARQQLLVLSRRHATRPLWPLTPVDCLTQRQELKKMCGITFCAASMAFFLQVAARAPASVASCTSESLLVLNLRDHHRRAACPSSKQSVQGKVEQW